jgi:hypothetical protein
VKKAVFNEMPEDVDLKATSRRYVESISKIHEVARGLIAGSVNSARAAIEAARARYAAVYPDNLVGITASAMREEREVSFVPLHLEWDDVRIELPTSIAASAGPPPAPRPSGAGLPPIWPSCSVAAIGAALPTTTPRGSAPAGSNCRSGCPRRCSARDAPRR